MRLTAAIALILLLLSGGAAGQTQKKTWPWLKQGEARIPVYPEIAVNADWVMKHLGGGDLLPIDVRDRGYGEGHLPGARPLNFSGSRLRPFGGLSLEETIFEFSQ